MNAKYLILLLLLFSFSCAKKEMKHEHASHSAPPAERMNDELHLSDLQVQLGNITTDVPRVRNLGDELILNATTTLNQQLVKAISARAMGRIEKLYFKNTGERLEEGQPVYEIYSEEINTAIRELMLSVEKKKIIKSEALDIDRIISGTKRKLILLGLAENQIQEIEKKGFSGNTVVMLSPVSGIITTVDAKEGSYVMAGTDIFHLANYSSLWIEAQVFQNNLQKINQGSMATITFPSLPGKKIEAQIIFVNPELSPSSRFNIVRAEIPNTDNQFVPGMQAFVSILTSEVAALSLPVNAILLDSKGATVWIKTAHNTFKSKMVETGIESNGFTEIKSGLLPTDTVVVTGAYLLNSEYIFKKGTNPMEGHDMSKM